MSLIAQLAIAAVFGTLAYGILRGKILRPLTDCERGIHSPGPFKTFFEPRNPRTPFDFDAPAGKRQSCTRCGKALVEQSYRFR